MHCWICLNFDRFEFRPTLTRILVTSCPQLWWRGNTLKTGGSRFAKKEWQLFHHNIHCCCGTEDPRLLTDTVGSEKNCKFELFVVCWTLCPSFTVFLFVFVFWFVFVCCTARASSSPQAGCASYTGKLQHITAAPQWTSHLSKKPNFSFSPN